MGFFNRLKGMKSNTELDVDDSNFDLLHRTMENNRMGLGIEEDEVDNRINSKKKD